MKKIKTLCFIICFVFIIELSIFIIRVKNYFNFLTKTDYKRFWNGLGVFTIFNVFFIKMLTYGVIADNFQNLLYSFSLMIIISIFLRYTFIKIYDYRKKDILLIEAEKLKEENSLAKKINLFDINQKEKNNITKRIENLKSKNKYGLMFGLVMYDPIITALYFRPDHHKWNGLGDKKTCFLFVISDIICSLIAGSIVMGLLKIF